MSVGKRYARALEASVAGASTVVYYEDAFSDLWSDDPEAELGLRDSTPATPIVLVSDGAEIGGSGDERLLQKHLTVLDWALSFSLKKANAGQPIRAIVIFDLTAAGWMDSWAWRMRYQLLADMPWVKLVAPIPPKSGGRTAHGWAMAHGKDPGALGQCVGGGWEFDLTEVKRPIDGPKHAATLLELHRLWTASVNLSDEHHDINNIIGARLLLDAKPSATDQPLVKAILRRIGWCQPKDLAPPLWQSWRGASGISKALFNTVLSVVVIDDNLAHGWDRVLGRLFGATTDYAAQKNEGRALVAFGATAGTPPSIFLCGSHRPDPLIAFLANATFDSRDFSKQVSPVKDAMPEIIFLDLRLYAGPDDAKQKAKELLAITQAVQKEDDAKLAWRKFDPHELRGIEDWVQSKMPYDEQTAMDALLLLPRLLALALPLTPIIIFSSTGQARAREKLKPYENIFTGFEKPRPLGNRASAADGVSALTTALEKAVPMMRLRLKLAHVQQAIQIANRGRKADLTRNGHYEIFIEESLELDEGVVSGALLLEFPSVKLSDALQRRLFIEFTKSGVCWTKRAASAAPKLMKSSDINKYMTEGGYKQQVGELVSILEDVGMGAALRKNWTFLSTATKITNPDKEALSEGLDRFPDKYLDSAIIDNVCFFLFSYIEYVATDVSSISIYLPTRIVPYGNASVRNMLSDLYGLFKIPGHKYNMKKSRDEYFVQTYGRDAGFPMFRNELQSWGKRASDVRRKIASLKSQTLSPHVPLDDDTVKSVRLIHDLADWTCAAGRIRKEEGDQQRDKLFRKNIDDHELVNNWFVSQPVQVKASDLNSFHGLIAANRSSYLSGDASSEQNPIAHLALVPYVRDCEGRLVDSADLYLKQHRIVLWSMRATISGADGKMLHAAI